MDHKEVKPLIIQINSKIKKEDKEEKVTKKKMTQYFVKETSADQLLKSAVKQLDKLQEFLANLSDVDVGIQFDFEEYITPDKDSLENIADFWKSQVKNANNSSNKNEDNLPKYFTMSPSTLAEADIGVRTEVSLPEGVVFGPYPGRLNKDCKDVQSVGYTWMVSKAHKSPVIAEDSSKIESNWLKSINYADSEDKQNVIAFQYKEGVYFKTYKSISPFEELLVWYSEELAMQIEVDSSPAKKVEGYSSPMGKILFNAKDDLFTHENTDYGIYPNNKYHCNDCSFSTSDETLFQQHRTTYFKEESEAEVSKTYICRTCDQVFLQSSDLSVHEKTHLNEKLFTCHTCDETFTSNQHLQVHRKAHSERNPYSCSTCGKYFDQILNLKAHVKTHTTLRPYRCSYCTYRTNKSIHLQQHAVTHHAEKLELNSSEMEKFFDKSSKDEKHSKKKSRPRLVVKKRKNLKVKIAKIKDRKASKTKKKQRIALQTSYEFCCHLCDYKSFRKEHFSKHMTSNHPGSPYKCFECGSYVFTWKNFSKHLKTHQTSKKERSNKKKKVDEKNITPKLEPLSDEYSEIIQPTKGYSLRNGRSIEMQFDIKPFKCDFCEFVCDQSEKLSLHISLKHTEDYDYLCAQCGSGFSRAVRLKRHIEEIHIEVDPINTITNYDDNVVNRNTRISCTNIEQSNSDDPIIVAEIDTKPLPCTQCDFICYHSRLLAVHVIQEHTHNYPFVCPQCNEGFFRPVQLRDHFSKMHSEANRTSTVKHVGKNKGGFNMANSSNIFIKSETPPRYMCPHCDFGCPIAQDLTHHVIAKHTTDSAYACCQCKKKFDSPLNLRYHFQTIHVAGAVIEDQNFIEFGEIGKKLKRRKSDGKKKTTDKKFKCPQCSYTSAFKQNLTQHEIVKHTGKYPFFCFKCGKGFTRKYRMKHHTKTCR